MIDYQVFTDEDDTLGLMSVRRFEKPTTVLHNIREAYFGSFEMHYFAKSFAKRPDTRFKVQGFIVKKAHESIDDARFVRTNSLAEIEEFWNSLNSQELSADHDTIVMVDFADLATDKSFAIVSEKSAIVEFEDATSDAVIQAFSNTFDIIAESLKNDGEAEKHMDELFLKALVKSRADRELS